MQMIKNSRGLGLLALIFGKTALLLLFVIIGIVLLAIALLTLMTYGLVTAVVLFAITGLGIVLLQYAHLIDLTKQPWFLLVPFAMFGLGYFSEHFRVFSISPQYSVYPGAGAVTLFNAPAQLIILTIVVALVIVAVAALIKRKRS